MTTRAAAAIVALVTLALGCPAPPPAAPRAPAADQLRLYREQAFIVRRLEIALAGGDRTTVMVPIAAGLRADDLMILDADGLAVADLRAVTSDVSGGAAAAPQIAIDVAAPRAGRFALVVGYLTDRVQWTAGYTMLTSAAREHATLRGAVSIRNTSGVALRGRATLIDAARADPDDFRPADRRAPRRARVTPCELGDVALGDGETHVDLPTDPTPRALRSVLVYDPIGTRLDHPGGVPLSEPTLGLRPPPTTQVRETLEIARPARISGGLPVAPVQLHERRADGGVTRLGDGVLFGEATRGATADSVEIGTASGVVGRRERRGWSGATDDRRISEEILVTIDNARARPVDVVVREHLYRGRNWTLAYHSAPAVKEGPQQIALRVTVPPGGRAKVLYVVVYTW